MTPLSILRTCIVVTTFTLSSLLFIFGFMKSGGFVTIAGIFWLFAQGRDWRWASYLLFMVFLFFTVRIAFQDIPPEWPLIIVTLTLFAWDLDYFINRLKRGGDIRKKSELERRHWKRLLLIALLGLSVGEMVFRTNFEIDLVWIIVIAITAALGLNLFLSTARSQSEKE